jgi:alpha-mannosidase II
VCVLIRFLNAPQPFLKTMARRVDAELHAVDIVFGVARAAHALVERAIGGSSSASGFGGSGGHAAGSDMDAMFPQLLQARQDAALFLHHDAITGTARKATNEDYMRRMTDASANLMHIFAKASEFLLSRQGLLHAHTSTATSAAASSSSSSATSPAQSATDADLSTASAPLHAGLADRLLDANDGRAHALVLFNALAWRRCELVVARVASPHVHVVDADGAPVLAQVF